MGVTFSRLGRRWPDFGEVAKAKPTEPELALAERLALQFEDTIAAAVLNLLNAQVDAFDVQALIAALESGSAEKVLAVVDAAAKAAEGAMAGKVLDALQDAVWAAGGMALAAPGTPPVFSRMEFHFDRINPVLVKWMQEYNFGLIRQINDTTREAIRDVLVENMREGQGPIRQAVKIKDSIGLTARQSAAVANFRRHLETFHTKRTAASWGLGKEIDRVNGRQVLKPDEDGKPKDGILNRRLRDFRYDGLLQKAINTRKPLKPEQVDRMVEAYARKYRAYRSRVIARTESLRATNVGVQEAFRQAIEQGRLSEDLVRRIWVVAKDERLCPVCAPVPKMNENGVKFAQPFATPAGPVFLPPLHPQCRCTVWIKTVEAIPDTP